MRVFIIHHHLHPGGVTSVIKSQVTALRQRGYNNITVLTGNNAHAPAALSGIADIQTLPIIDYLPDESVSNQSLYSEILREFSKRFKKDDILHFHNLNLGKNPVYSLAVFQLAEEGFQIFNHVHDFAEDRPRNMQLMRKIVEKEFQKPLEKIMYPVMRNYAFGVLTSHDKKRIAANGINSGRISVLPNPVNPPSEVTREQRAQIRKDVFCQFNLPEDRKLAVYPVRGITRKNLGEFILLSALLEKDYVFALTQPPKNPGEIPQYDEWKSFSQWQKLPVVFEAGQKTDFLKLMHTSDICFTTSVMEGFGMVYLEPWLFNTPVAGRNLPDVTADFFAAGIKLDTLYNGLYVYVESEVVDFASLENKEKKNVIKRAKTEKNYLNAIAELNNDFIKRFSKIDENVINYNKKIIFDNYSLKKYGEKLHVAYSEVIR